MSTLRKFRGVRSIWAMMLLVAASALGMVGARLRHQQVEAERRLAEADAAINDWITLQKDLAVAENVRKSAEVKRLQADNPSDAEEYRKLLEEAKRRRSRPDAATERSRVFHQLGTWPD